MGVPGYKGMSKPVVYKGVRYESYTEAGRHFGLRPEVVKQRLEKGQPLERKDMRSSQR